MDVWKVGGNELDSVEFLVGLARAMRNHARPIVLVHGGGQAITTLQARLGIETRKIAGLRVTTDADMVAVQLALVGDINKRIVLHLLEAGVDAFGFSGLDGGVLRCVPKQHPAGDLGWVGETESVRASLLQQLLALGVTPILAPVSLGTDSDGNLHAYNVNADDAAQAVALALGADTLTFISNVPGVLRDGVLCPDLRAQDVTDLIAQGTITGGMVLKVEAALQAVRAGVNQVRITNLAGLLAGTGTKIAA